MKHFFIILFCIVFISTGFAQDSSSSVTVTYSKVSYHRSQRDNNIFNLIKINPLLILNGDIPIYYERRIADQFSIEGSLGITYTDYFYQAFSLDEYSYDDERSSNLGYSASIAAKFYPSRSTRALDEIYFGPEIRYRRYNTQVKDCGNLSSTGFISERRILADFKITGGYISYISDRVIADIYGGIGLRSRDISLAHCDALSTGSGMTYERINDMVPVISAGVKLGFAF